jgi:hypothetical protein
MTNELVKVLEDRRLTAGRNGKPLGYKAWGDSLGVVHTTLFRFAKGERALGIEAIRTLARRAEIDNDTELLYALAGYALGVELPIVDKSPVIHKISTERKKL